MASEDMAPQGGEEAGKGPAARACPTAPAGSGAAWGAIVHGDSDPGQTQPSDRWQAPGDGAGPRSSWEMVPAGQGSGPDQRPMARCGLGCEAAGAVVQAGPKPQSLGLKADPTGRGGSLDVAFPQHNAGWKPLHSSGGSMAAVFMRWPQAPAAKPPAWAFTGVFLRLRSFGLQTNVFLFSTGMFLFSVYVHLKQYFCHYPISLFPSLLPSSSVF